MLSGLATLGLFLGLTSGTCAILPTWYMHRVCGQTISQSDKGGFLVLDSDSLPASDNIDCRVVIQPAVTKSSFFTENHVAFHLSNFEVGKYCKHTNFTVYDGHGKQTQPVEGECGTGDFDVFTCNGTKRWCIGEELVCQNLNPCTDDSDCLKVTPEEIVFNIIGVVIPIIVFLLFIACCCCIIQTGTNSSFRGRCEEGSRTAVQLVRGIWDCMRNGRKEMEEYESAASFHPDIISDRFVPGPSAAAENDPASTLAFSTQHNNDYSTFTKEREAAASYYQDLSPSAPPLAPEAEAAAPPLAPEAEAAAPPSYDEVLTNETLYLKKE